MSTSYPFAQRTNWSLATNKFSTNLELLRQKKVPILDLTESNPTHCDFSYFKKGLLDSFNDEENLHYMPSPRGNLEAREAICWYYKEKGLSVSPEQIFLTASTSEAYSYLFRLLVNPGEEVLFPRPSYPLFSFLGDLGDVHMATYPLIYDGRWSIDIEKIRQTLGDHTKALMTVNPNNPTGSFMHQKELDDMNVLCRERNIALICDEVFSDFAFDPNKNQVSLVNNDQVLTFVLGGISKTLGLPQMKLSWIIVNGPEDAKKDASARLEVITDTYLSVNTPAQNALPLWLSYCKTIQEEIRGRTTQNFNFLQKYVKTTEGCQLLATEGGWYTVLRIPDVYGEEEWVLTFLAEDHVAVHPGYFFDFENEAFIIIGLLPPCHTFEEGIKRICKRIKERRVLTGTKSQTC